MITCASKGFCFIHVPKAGGTTIRTQIEDMDDYDLQFGSGVREFPQGRFRMAHLPLDVLRSNFPAVFKTICGLTSHAIVRDPRDRFFSAVGQHLKETHGKFANELSDIELRKMVETIVQTLSDADPYPDKTLAHFIRQRDFIMLDGEQIVTRLYPLDRLQDLADALSEASGRSVTNLKLNQSVTFKNRSLKAPLVATKNLFKRILPVKTYSTLKDLALPVFTQQGADARLEDVADDLGLNDFITTFYADDFALYRAARTNEHQTGTANAH